MYPDRGRYNCAVPKVYIVMGVAGSGKTTVGSLLASRFACAFSDADQFHSTENKQKMGSGIPLTDEDRVPWLAAMQTAIAGWLERGEAHVLACSALKDSYRKILQVDDQAVVFVYLDAPRELIESRLSARQHHYMKVGMIESQFTALEAPDKEHAIVVDASNAPEAIVEQVIRSVHI